MTLSLREDVLPVTELMQKAAKIIENIRKTKRPLLITQNGRAAMICLDVEEYQAQMRKLELIDALLEGERDFSEGRFSRWKDFELKLNKM